MNPLSTYGLDLGSVLSKLSSNKMRLGFEHQFNAIQNTTIKRINSEIQRVIDNDSTPRDLETLQREYDKLEANKSLIDGFHIDVRSNQERLTRMQTAVSEAIAAFSTDDDDTNLTADELTTLEAKRDALVEDIELLLVTVHPDIANPHVIQDIKNELETLKGRTPVAGTVDAAGSGSPSNDNRNLYDDLTSLSTLIDTAYDVTSTTATNASQISLTISANMASKTSDLTELSSVQLQRRQEEIDEIKSKYGNLLRSISLSFEARLSSLEQLGTSLEGQTIAPGSVMNLFT